MLREAAPIDCSGRLFQSTVPVDHPDTPWPTCSPPPFSASAQREAQLHELHTCAWILGHTKAQPVSDGGQRSGVSRHAVRAVFLLPPLLTGSPSVR